VVHGEVSDDFVSFLGHDLEPVLWVSHWQPKGSGQMQFVHPVIGFGSEVDFLRLAVLGKHFFAEIFLFLQRVDLFHVAEPGFQCVLVNHIPLPQHRRALLNRKGLIKQVPGYLAGGDLFRGEFAEVVARREVVVRRQHGNVIGG